MSELCPQGRGEGYEACADVGHGVGQPTDPHQKIKNCNKKASKTEVFKAFGADRQIRTADLILTNWLGAFQPLISNAF